jgi:hypothetical protein
MKRIRVSVLLWSAALMAGLLPLPASASHCTIAGVAGDWAYTYTGTIFAPNGALPAASVGHFHTDVAGNLNGGQTRTVAGASGLEDITGTVAVNHDCTATATIEVLVNGQLQRTAVLALIYDRNQNHIRGIFQSLTTFNGTAVPVVLTIDAARLFSEH